MSMSLNTAGLPGLGEQQLTSTCKSRGERGGRQGGGREGRRHGQKGRSGKDKGKIAEEKGGQGSKEREGVQEEWERWKALICRQALKGMRIQDHVHDTNQSALHSISAGIRTSSLSVALPAKVKMYNTVIHSLRSRTRAVNPV